MTKLKTLKDLELSEDFLDPAIDKELKPIENKLRQEAIKWYKANKSHFYSREEKEGAKNWIKMFFNLTDEDLK